MLEGDECNATTKLGLENDVGIAGLAMLDGVGFTSDLLASVGLASLKPEVEEN